MPIQGQTDTTPTKPVGGATNVAVTSQGQLHVIDAQVLAMLEAILVELRLLRIGMIAANDSVCVDLEGELTGLGVSQE